METAAGERKTVEAIERYAARPSCSCYRERARLYKRMRDDLMYETATRTHRIRTTKQYSPVETQDTRDVTGCGCCYSDKTLGAPLEPCEPKRHAGAGRDQVTGEMVVRFACVGCDRTGASWTRERKKATTRGTPIAMSQQVSPPLDSWSPAGQGTFGDQAILRRVL
jgi:hypothetical protein